METYSEKGMRLDMELRYAWQRGDGPTKLAPKFQALKDHLLLGECALADAHRLDWLDATNKPFKMGWTVGLAPAGNVSIHSPIYLGDQKIAPIREAIDKAVILQEGKMK